MHFLIGLLLVIIPLPAFAGEGGGLVYFEYMGILLLIGLLAGALAEKMDQPRILGWLVGGAIFGNLLPLFEMTVHDFGSMPEVHGFVLLGVNLLLLSVGLESNVDQLMKAGARSMAVAVVGMAMPLLAGIFLLGPFFFPDVPWTGHLFLGAALTATSVSVPAAILKSRGALGTTAANTTIGAAVIDDVGGLITLAVCKGIVVTGALSYLVAFKLLSISVAFLIGAVLIGKYTATYVSRWMSRLDNGDEMKLGFVVSLMFLVAWLASSIGLDGIVGSFVVGLILDRVHFEGFREHRLVSAIRRFGDELNERSRQSYNNALRHYQDEHVEDLTRPLLYIFTAPFFVLVGGSVDVFALVSHGPAVLVVLVVAVLTKLCAGLCAAKGDRWLVGWAMVPRGEVGLIFATIGNQMGVMNVEMYSVLVSVITLSTLIPALILPRLLK